jgi:hypothetical protein
MSSRDAQRKARAYQYAQGLFFFRSDYFMKIPFLILLLAVISAFLVCSLEPERESQALCGVIFCVAALISTFHVYRKD